MAINSLNFFLFFLIITLVYYILPKSFQWVWLLAASLFCYYQGESKERFAIFIGIILLNWLSTIFMDENNKWRKTSYTCILWFNILSLVMFKYIDFLCDIIKPILLGSNIISDVSKINRFVEVAEYFAPKGISYFSLILIGYVTDVYWCKVKPQKNLGKTMLFASFFPQITSGPIVRYEEMQDQLWGEKKRFSYNNMIRGGERLLWGLFKKIVVAERCAVIVNAIYDKYEVYKGFYIWVAAVMFAMQLYCDFSGLMDIVLGYSEVLGIYMPENFNTPFYSLSLSEFWRRWHITLGAFLRDYILYPVQRTKVFVKLRKFCKKKLGKGYEKKWNLPLHLSLLISWFLIGLWHGGGWNYIFGVGLYMWIVIVSGELLTPVFGYIVRILHINTDCDSYRLFLRIRTFVLFIMGLSFFRAKTLQSGFQMWKQAFSQFNIWIFFDKSMYNLGLDRAEWAILLFGLFLIFVVSFISQKHDFREYISQQNFLFRIIVFSILFIFVICWGYYGMDFNAADFIYGRF